MQGSKEWFDIPEYSRYQVTRLGELRNKHSMTELSLRPRADGYVALSLYNDSNVRVSSVRVHTLVASTFLSNPEKKPTVNHKNKIRNDNSVDNLEWATRKEQVVHALAGRKSCTPGRQVWQCNLETHERLQSYPSVAAAKRALGQNGTKGTSRIGAVASKQKTSKGYTCRSAAGFWWEYADEEVENQPGEEWKPVVCLETICPYRVSSHGRLRGPHGRLHDSHTGADGYVVCSINGCRLKLHIVVARTFLPNPKGLPCVNHIDGNRENACANNLEWVSFSENSIHAGLLGLTVHKIRSVEAYGKKLGDLVGSWPTSAAAGKATNLPACTISRVCRGDGGQRAAGNMYWKFADGVTSIHGVKAFQNGVQCGQWLNVKAAAQVIGCSVSGLLSVCEGKRSSMKGLSVERAYIALGAEITTHL